ncbi:MAG TPA: hypothetical protein VFB90_03330 [Dehalococcoidia bacterium]|nr:hypothetical protein [Dehalococcoidia bacterium]
MNGVVTLIGAGELMSATSHLHRAALTRVGRSPRAVFLDTTAGFETNIDAIVQKAVEYYSHHLQTELHVARYRHSERVTPAEAGAAIAEVRAADIIFAGPGSPTYAVQQWRNSPLWDEVLQRFQAGAHLLFASAASITLGRYTLPVYEIYKAGADPYWEEGLDLLGQLGLNVAIVPHFNDNSGGENYDSRFCYVGARRFDALQEQLPPDITILGIDAYTAVVLDPATRQATIAGQGGLTVIGDGEQQHYPSGSQLPFEALQTTSRELVATAREEQVYTGYDYADDPGTEDDIQSLVTYIEGLSALGEPEKLELITRLQRLREQQQSAPGKSDDGLVGLILELRSNLRELKRYDLADQARDRLNELGYEISDSPQGATWQRR